MCMIERDDGYMAIVLVAAQRPCTRRPIRSRELAELASANASTVVAPWIESKRTTLPPLADEDVTAPLVQPTTCSISRSWSAADDRATTVAAKLNPPIFSRLMYQRRVRSMAQLW